MTLPNDALLSCARMGECDRLTIAAGTSGFALMRRAGLGVATALRRRFRPGRVLVACGPGNNGGDGYVIADDLRRHGWDVTVAALVNPKAGDPAALTGDAAEAANLWAEAPVPLSPDLLDHADILVDSLFGAGLTRAIEGSAAEFLERARDRARNGRLSVLAVDVPSGVHGDTGQVLGTACPADLTVTFHRRKPGHLLEPGGSLCGTVRVIDIGIDPQATAHVAPTARENTPALWSTARPVAGPTDHKYSRGHVIVLAGAMSGAARLAARAARRMGAGLVTVIAPDGAVAAVAADAPGVIVQPLDAVRGRLDRFVTDRKAAALVLGPGLGTTDESADLARNLLAAEVPAVLDADVFTLFAGQDLPTSGPAVLTPHGGEFQRFRAEIDVANIGRIDAVVRVARDTGHVVLLKGADTTVADPDGRCTILDGAPASLATGGSGDVLSGAVAALVGQGMPAFEAAAAGAWLHADAARRLGSGALLPEDLADALRWP